MKPKPPKNELELFQSHLDQILDQEHPLCKLSRQIDWGVFEEKFGPHYSPGKGRPGIPIRVMVSLHYLKHAYDVSDERVVESFLENPYWQYFSGFEYFQHRFPLHPTALVKWRKRVGPKGMETLLVETIAAAKRQKLIKRNHLDKVNVDTTVQEKAIAYPTPMPASIKRCVCGWCAKPASAGSHSGKAINVWVKRRWPARDDILTPGRASGPPGRRAY